MAKSIEPVQYVQFGGLCVSGHPLRRPAASAAKCDNFRIMPGGYLRLRGGRVIRYDGSSGRFTQFHQFQRADGSGSIEIMAFFDSTPSEWMRFTLGATILPNHLEDVPVNGGTFRAAANVRNRCFLGNGQGVVGGGVSRPALSSWDGTQLRYVGLDTYLVGGNPTAAFAIGAGYNNIQTSRTFYVGLYNAGTGHFSNGVSAGTISTPGTGTITISNLDRLTHVSHDVGELAELFYVFYVSVDGGETGALIMDATGLVPLTTPVGTGSQSLSIVSSDSAGFIRDQTQERPITNFPPRPMSHIVNANGRIYGLLKAGGVGAPYALVTKESPAVVWCAAADDVQDNDFVGLPEESWPLTNKKYPPGGDQPLFCAPGPNESNVLVLTKRGTFILEETADGLHEWTTVSATEGIGQPESYAQTPYGAMWITQKWQLVILRPGQPNLEVLSNDFQPFIPTGLVGAPYLPLWADYVSSPTHQIDQYQVGFSDSTRLTYDFYMNGQAYRATNLDYSAGKTVNDAFGMRYHLVAKAKIWTQEVDPFLDQVPVLDQNEANAWSEIDGEFVGQWQDFGDSSLRKEITEFDVIGDMALSSAQLGSDAGTVMHYRDLSLTPTTGTLRKVSQAPTDRAYRIKVAAGNAMWFKARILLAGHSQDEFGTANTQKYYDAPSVTGDLAPSVYGCVWGARVTMNPAAGNRP